jgi:hypothetical protein
LWETYFDVERHPTMTAIWHAGGFGHGTRQAAADSYRFGLDRLLDGIQTLATLGPPAPTSRSDRSDSGVE